MTINWNFEGTDDLSVLAAESSGARALLDQLSGETAQALSQLGITDLSPGGILDLRPGAILRLLHDLLRAQSPSALRIGMSVCGIMLAVSVCLALLQGDEKQEKMMSLVSGTMLLVQCASFAFQTIQDGSAAITACADFEKLLIPVLAALLTASGSPTAALSVQGTAFLGAQLLEAFAAQALIPLLASITSLFVLDSILPGHRLAESLAVIRRTLLRLFASAAGLFSGLLSMKGVLASSVDALAIRSVRLAGSFVPVVGSAVGEAVSAAFGSVALMKNTVGLIGILILLLLCLPMMIRLLVHTLLLRGCALFGRLIGCDSVASVPDCFADLCSVMNAILLFSLLICIVTAGLTVAIGGRR